MNAIFKKLNFRDHEIIYVVNAPASFNPHTEEMKSFCQIKTNIEKARSIEFLLAFVTKQKEVDDLAKKAALRMAGDGLIWFAYPKGTSKKYTCEFNRDNGWAALGKHGFEGVRMIAIDDDWSALRFRKAGHIKTMKRNFAMSAEGKKKVAEGKAKSTMPKTRQ